MRPVVNLVCGTGNNESTLDSDVQIPVSVISRVCHGGASAGIFRRNSNNT